MKEDRDEELEYADSSSGAGLSLETESRASELGPDGAGYIWQVAHDEHSVAPIPEDKLAEITQAMNDDDMEDESVVPTSGELKSDADSCINTDVNDPGDDYGYFEKAVEEGIKVELGILEINSPRLSYNMESAECDGAIFYSMMKLAVDRPHSSASDLSSSPPPPSRPKWRKVAYGGMQTGYDDNYTDETFLEEMVMNANVVRRDLLKAMKDSVSISQYLCIVALVVLVWFHTLQSSLDENSLLLLDLSLLPLGFLVLLLTQEKMLSLTLLLRYLTNITFFTTGLYVLAPVYQTLTRSISSDSIWAVTASLLLLHLFCHDYSGSTIRAPGALLKGPSLTSCVSVNASIVASVFVASRLSSRGHVFAVMLFSLQVFLFAPLVAYCIKKFSFGLHLGFSFALVGLTLYAVYVVHRLLFVLLLVIVVVVNVVCPYWLIRMQEYKFEINGPWDEAKLCFDITD